MKNRIGICTLVVAVASLSLFGSGCGRSDKGGKTLQVALLENKSGEFIPYSNEAAQKALSGAEFPADLIVWAEDPTEKGSYPIVTYTWMLCFETYADKQTAEAMKTMIHYCLDEGQKHSESLGYIPLPEGVVAKVKAAAEKIKSAGGTDGDSRLKGAGATFPAPIYQKWFKDLKTAKDVQVDYQANGSGQGVKLFLDGVVDFGASDAAMSADEIKKANALASAPKGVVLLPMTAGAIVVAYNLPEVKDLKLPRDVYGKIFTGKITKWNDEAIKKANPSATLPDKTIKVITRQDSSGTTYVFTKHLSAISPEFKSEIGVNKAPSWPNTFTAAKGNDGVTAQIQATPGSVGYIEYSFAKAAK